MTGMGWGFEDEEFELPFSRKTLHVSGQVIRIQHSGFGVVQLDDGREAFFDRFAPLASRLKGGLHVGSRIHGEAVETDEFVLHLKSLAIQGQ